MKDKNTEKKALHTILRQVRSFLFGILTETGLGILVAALGVWLALFSKEFIDVATGAAEGGLLQKGIQLALLIGIQLVVQIVYTVYRAKVSGRFSVTLRSGLFQSLMRKNLSAVGGYHSGDLLNRIYSDVSVITVFFTDALPNTVALSVRVILSFAAMWKLDYRFALICILLGPLVLISARLYRKPAKRLHKQCQEADSDMRSFMQECLQNLLVIKSFGREEGMAEQAENKLDGHYRLVMKKTWLGIFANVLFFIGITVGYYAALVWGAYRISVGLMTFGTLTAMLQLVGQVQSPFREISGVFSKYYAMLASAERLTELMDLPQELPRERSKVREELYRRMKALVFDNVTFSYRKDDSGEQVVLDHYSNTVSKGEFMAICGNSGIGKSTMLKLLLGVIHPDEGSVSMLCDDGEVVPAGEGLRGLFAYVPQGNLILSGTVRQNIAFTLKEEEIDDAAVERAAKAAEIWQDISALPDGVHTMLGEHGAGLSEGQTQRIAIARAFYDDAPVLLLDEATSALDEATELAVLQNIRRQENKTCLIVTHKKAALSFCERTAVLGEKKTAEPDREENAEK